LRLGAAAGCEAQTHNKHRPHPDAHGQTLAVKIRIG
jgi:hypothetical protein